MLNNAFESMNLSFFIHFVRNEDLFFALEKEFSFISLSDLAEQNASKIESSFT